MKKLETNSNASSRQKNKKEIILIVFYFNYGLIMIKEIKNFKLQMVLEVLFINRFSIISVKIMTLQIHYSFKVFSELNEKQYGYSFIYFYLKASNSINDDDVKLSERLYIPSK